MTNYKVKLDQFEGPLDLLLNLIVEEELDITEISLAKITDQYIKYLEKIEDLRPEDLADFLVIATKLLLIKSRSMMPYLQQEEEDEGVSLTDQLRIYKEFHDAALKMEERLKEKHFTYGRVDKYYEATEPMFAPPKDFTSDSLKEFFSDVLIRLEPIVRLPKKALSKTVSLKEKIVHLHGHLEKFKKASFKEIINQAKDKTEMIVTFLAILELVKGQKVSVAQTGHFEDIEITKV